VVSEAFEVFPSNDGFYWQQAGGTVRGPFATRAEAQDNAIEHLLDRARGEHGKRLAALYHALTAVPRTDDSKPS
jgi:hypothetical protein